MSQNVLLPVCLFLLAKAEHHEHGKMAECVLKNALKGTIQIHSTGDKNKDTMFMGSIKELAEGKHGFHVHEVDRQDLFIFTM